MDPHKPDIPRRMNRLLADDRRQLRKGWDRLNRDRKAGLDDSELADRRTVFEKRLLRAEERKKQRLDNRPALLYPEGLPILEKKNEIISALRRHQVLVIMGETGSGKTTQLPKMCLAAGRGIHGLIGCTQPRRIAAVSIAKRVAEELGQESGRAVGYKIRFEDRTSRQGYIKFMTDGILLMEAQADPLLRRYDTLIIDEAHERSINIDFILGYLKGLIEKRKDLRIIITSATIDPHKFSLAFNDAPIIEVSGRTWPVDVRYRPPESAQEDDGSSAHVEAAALAVSELKRDRQRGNILVFMPTEQDIRDTCRILEGRNYSNTVVLPLYARLPGSQQQRIFPPSREDKIIVATNVAETSITVPGVRYVVDTGLARISEYRPQTRTTGLPVKQIAKSSVIQRTGRAGRLEKGICIRLYSESDYLQRPDFTPPEIMRTNLAEVILRMLHLKLGDMATFPFIDKPRPKHVRDGYDILVELGAIVTDRNGYRLTDQGRRMAVLPLDPRIARIILEASRQSCLKEILVIAAALSIQDPRERPPEKEEEARRAQKAFVNPSSDFITLLNIWNAFNRTGGTSGNRKRSFCREHFLSWPRMREWRSVHDELAGILEDSGISTGDHSSSPLIGEDLYEAIHKCILTGYISQFGLRKEKNIYRFAKGKEAMIFPGSGLFNGGSAWIVSAEMVETSRVFARINGMIKSEWLEQAGGSLCRKSWSSPRWDPDRGEVVASEQVSLFGIPVVTDRTVSYGPVNPEEASEVFINEALLEEQIYPQPAFLKHNRSLIEGLLTMENKIRRRNILVDQEDLAGFYRERLAPVSDARTLKTMIRRKGSDEFLRMTEEDIRRWFPSEELERYPDQVRLGGARFSLTYRFDPGAGHDGVTLNIPPHLLRQAAAESPEWKIPGLLREKIQALLKGLPKEYRRQLIPLGETVETIMKALGEREEGDDGSLLQTLSAVLREQMDVAIPATAWSLDNLPDHLAIRYALVSKKKREMKASRNIDDLLSHGGDDRADNDLERARRILERGPLKAWDVEELPPWQEVSLGHKRTVKVYLALAEEEGSVFLRIFRSHDDARERHSGGIRRLWEIACAKDRKYLEQCLALPDALRKGIPWPGGAPAFEALLARQAAARLVDGSVRSRNEFTRMATEIRPRIYETAHSMMESVEPVLRLYIETRRAIADMTERNRHNRELLSFLQSLSNHLDHLVSPDFPARYETGRLERIPVYIRGIALRTERGMVHLEKDRSKEAATTPFTEALERLQTTVPSFSSAEKLRALDELAWTIEEFRLSLFAPELKTAGPVSSKRLNRKISEIEAMI